jgi:hypothetical protein
VQSTCINFLRRLAAGGLLQVRLGAGGDRGVIVDKAVFLLF